jgi:hypothetical protein
MREYLRLLDAPTRENVQRLQDEVRDYDAHHVRWQTLRVSGHRRLVYVTGPDPHWRVVNTLIGTSMRCDSYMAARAAWDFARV